ncbi:MAG TPA: homoserine kinase [Streptosporangiaceae bacterium]|nr:homoserine kinase [Streptosporangiaceae bacterium]
MRNGRTVRVRVPATSANLGPGFDALGLALAWYDEVQAEITGGGLCIEVTGEGSQTAGAGERHLVVRAMRAYFAAVGEQPPGLALHCVNAIPQRRGLGSSAGAVVAGLLGARGLLGGDGAGRESESLSDQALLGLATELEGHPDNAAACLAGGLTISWTTAAGPRAVRLSSHPVIKPVICVPATSLATSVARGALPAMISHRDAAASAGRSALLVAALTQHPDLLLDATEDLLHEPYRATLMPATADLIGRLRGAGIAAVLSGAGPAVMALTVDGPSPGPSEVDSIASQTGNQWLVSSLDVDRQGATIRTVPQGERIRSGARHGQQGSGLLRTRAGQAGRSSWDLKSPSAQHGQL